MSVHFLDVSDPYFAEAIFHFVSDLEVFEDFCLKSIEEDLSIAEYVQKYRKSDFSVWFEKHYCE